MAELTYYLEQVVQNQASDVFFVAGGPVKQKIEGHIVPIGEEKLRSEDTEKLIRLCYEKAGRPIDHFLNKGDDDFSFTIPGLARFRANTYRQRGSLAAVIRVVAFDIPDWRELNIPESVMDLADVHHGMILVTGTAGSGKTTTQACIIDRINETRECHVVTLEDPIEYLHRHKKSIVSQREVSLDTAGYLAALRACLRQAPDVILLGEMRDAETIHTAMTAAETGHMIMATLHTMGVVNTIDRIVDSFPAGQQGQIRIQLAAVLRTVVSQQLIPDKNGNLVPVYEIMHTNNAIRSMIRDNKNHQIDNVIATGGKEGMISMDQSILKLYKEGKISKQTALDFAEKPEHMVRLL